MVWREIQQDLSPRQETVETAEVESVEVESVEVEPAEVGIEAASVQVELVLGLVVEPEAEAG